MRIAQYLHDSYWKPVVPRNMANGMGGSETALISLSHEWAKKGHDVINVVPIENPFTQSYEEGGSVSYVSNENYYEILTNFYSDVLISWNTCDIFGIPDIRKNTNLAIVEVQMSKLMDLWSELDEVIDFYCALSEWHKHYMLSDVSFLTDSKVKVFPNGINLSDFDPKVGHPGDGPYTFYYASSSDRGLVHLLDAWPRIRKAFPESTLVVAYGIESFATHKYSHYVFGDAIHKIEEGLKQDGIAYAGKLGKSELYNLTHQADALLYPCDTFLPTETGCIAVLEALASATPAVLTDCDCLEQEFAKVSFMSPLPFSEDRFVEAVEILMNDKERYERLQVDGLSLANSRDWSGIAEKWQAFFQQNL